MLGYVCGVCVRVCVCTVAGYVNCECALIFIRSHATYFVGAEAAAADAVAIFHILNVANSYLFAHIRTNKYQRRWSFSRHCYNINLFNLFLSHISRSLILIHHFSKIMRKIKIQIWLPWGFMMLFFAQIEQYTMTFLFLYFLSICDKTCL